MIHTVGYLFFNSDDSIAQQNGRIIQLHDKTLVINYLQSKIAFSEKVGCPSSPQTNHRTCQLLHSEHQKQLFMSPLGLRTAGCMLWMQGKSLLGLHKSS